MDIVLASSLVVIALTLAVPIVALVYLNQRFKKEEAKKLINN